MATAQPPVRSALDDMIGQWNTKTAGFKPWKILLYGSSGSGKTYMAGTFPDPIFVDLEDGMRSVLSLDNNIMRYPKNPSEYITDLEQVKKFYNKVASTPPHKLPFKTIVIDSLNELQVLIMKNVLTFTANRVYEDQPTMTDYGKLARDMQQLIRYFIQLPVHVVFTAAATDKEYDNDKVYPAFVGKKSGPDVRRIIEQVGYCYTRQRQKDAPVEHVVAFFDSPEHAAKDRTHKLKQPIPNSYQAMMRIVDPNYGKEPAK